MSKIKLIADYVGPEGKYSPGHFHLALDQATPAIPVTGLMIEPKAHNQEGFKLTVELDASKYSGGSNRLRPTVEELINQSGIAGLKLEKSSHENSDSITLDSTNPFDITKILAALSKNVDLGKGQTAYGIINPNVVSSLADELSHAASGKTYGDEGDPKKSVPFLTSTNAYDFTVVQSSEGNKEYFVARSNIKGTTIEQVSSDGEHAQSKSGEGIVVGFTRIDVANKKMDEVKNILDKAGLSSDVHGNHINVKSSISDIADLLGKEGIIPESVRDSIIQRSNSLKGAFASAADMDETPPNPQVKPSGYTLSSPGL